MHDADLGSTSISPDHVPQTQMPIPSCEFRTRRNVNVISYAGWVEGGKSPRVRGGGRRHVEFGCGLWRKMEYRSMRACPCVPRGPRWRRDQLLRLSVTELSVSHVRYYLGYRYPIYIRVNVISKLNMSCHRNREESYELRV